MTSTSNVEKQQVLFSLFSLLMTPRLELGAVLGLLFMVNRRVDVP